jgi:acetate---CoA ligase (ADP-forming)
MSELRPLGALMRPRSVAIAGVSDDPRKLGSLPLQFLLKFGYDGDIYPINPKLGEAMGLKCYPSLASVGRPIDLVVVAVAAERIPALLEDSSAGQVRFALVLSSNYAEAGPDGAELQRELVGLASRKSIRLIGPNSVGIVNLWDRTVASISQVFDTADLEPGPVAFVSQSGAVGTAITALAREQDIGIGYFVSTGNEADLEFSDFCDAFVDDPRVSVIAGYLESVRDGARFQRSARRAIEAGKPIVLVKVGTTDVGGRAVRSHTGALAGSDAVYEAVFSAHGIVRADGIESLIDTLKMFVAYPPRSDGVRDPSRVAVLSHSGGAGVMMADASVGLGLEMPPPSPDLARKLQARLPSYAALNNPIDMTANVIFDPPAMTGCMLDAAQSGEYDAVMLCVNLIWRQGEALADALIGARAGTERVLGVTWIAGPSAPVKRLARAGLPVFGDPLRCVRAVAARLHWERVRRSALGSRPPATTYRGDDTAAAQGYVAQRSLLAQYRIDVAPGSLVGGHDDARRAARELGYPVAVKLIARSLPHKSDAGAVVLDVADDNALVRAMARLLAIPCPDREGVLVQRMIERTDAIELFVGSTQDSVFGPIVLFGLGGVFVEILRAVVMRPAPFDPRAAAAMIREARFFPMLAGARGRRACDVEALARLLAQVSTLAAEAPSVATLDLNPVLASPRGAIVVDFKLEPTRAPAPTAAAGG